MTGGVFAILDDIAMLLDDTAVMSKIAAKKTAGILGDDLAVNAEKATGFKASRELPVIWAITKGSFVNKLIILPVAFLLSAYAPWLIVPILLIGGCYLCFEGMEKIFHLFSQKHHTPPVLEEFASDREHLIQEKAKIQSAIRTDFILSIEIIVIALGTVLESTLALQIIVVSLIAILATIGVYGIVAIIVRMDDVGFYLITKGHTLNNPFSSSCILAGTTLVSALPWVIRALGIIGTLAMLLVGGGMFTHSIEKIHHALAFLPQIVANLLVGAIVGSALVIIQLVILKSRATSKTT